MADVDLDQAGELLISQVGQLGAGDPVVVVAHSAGGAVLTRAAQLAPRLVAHAVYLTAFMPSSGVSVQAHARMPENDGSLLRSLLVADPAAVGALRLDVACPEPAYRQRLREAFYGDVDPAVADAEYPGCPSPQPAVPAPDGVSAAAGAAAKPVRRRPQKARAVRPQVRARRRCRRAPG